jgi:hypothetical protein
MLLPLPVLGGSAPISDDLKADRADWRETIGDCRGVMGTTSALQLLCTAIQDKTSTAGTPQWNVVEACLSGLLFVGPTLPTNESTYMPVLIRFLATLPPELVALKTTSIELIGRVAKWVAYNPLYIPDILQTLTSCLSHAGLAVCASESLSEVLRACTHVMTPFSLPIHDLHDLVSRQRDAHALPLSADLNLLDGICTAMSSFDQQTCGAMLSAVVAPIARSLSSQLTQGYVHDTHLVMANIDRLTAVVRFTRVSYVSGEHPVMAAFLLLQPLCQRVLEVVTTEQACEKVCRLYKYCIRCTGKCFATYLRPMSAHLLTAFQSKQYSPLIYAASICVTEFGSSHGAHDELLYSMLWGFSSAFFAKCQTLTDFQNYPDVVEEYFHLLARYCTVYCVLCIVLTNYTVHTIQYIICCIW